METTEKDIRPWRTLKLSLPEPIAVQLEEAIWMAKGFGLANDRIEAIEPIAVTFLQEHYLGLLYAEQGAKSPYKVNSIQALKVTGFRCLLCETSKDLTVHHIWPRGYHGPERPSDIDCEDNLAPLCLACHEKVQPKWRTYVVTLLKARAKAKNQVREFGFRFTMKHSQGKGRKWT